MVVQRVHVVVDVLVQPALEVTGLFHFADRAPHDVGHGGGDQTEMKFQFQSAHQPVGGPSHRRTKTKTKTQITTCSKREVPPAQLRVKTEKQPH